VKPSIKIENNLLKYFFYLVKQLNEIQKQLIGIS